MLALNALEALGDKAAPVLEALRSMPTKDPRAPARANGYVDRMVKRLTGSGGEGPAGTPPAPRGKKP
jgi:hypothetical protein